MELEFCRWLRNKKIEQMRIKIRNKLQTSCDELSDYSPFEDFNIHQYNQLSKKIKQDDDEYFDDVFVTKVHNFFNNKKIKDPI